MAGIHISPDSSSLCSVWHSVQIAALRGEVVMVMPAMVAAAPYAYYGSTLCNWNPGVPPDFCTSSPFLMVKALNSCIK